MGEFNREKLENAVRLILEAIGEDPEREGLLDTPRRVANMYVEMFSGLNKDPKEELNTIFHEHHDDIVIVKDIPFYSMCEHHLVPFFGHVHIAYKPKNGQVTGLSKLARLVETTAKRPQLQERMTNMIVDAIMEKLEAQGVMVVIEAEHLCMAMRGIKKPGTLTVTVATKGIFSTDKETRKELLALFK